MSVKYTLGDDTMFCHRKQLLQKVRVDAPNPNYDARLQGQLGGPQEQYIK
jgi:Mn-containing catalase